MNSIRAEGDLQSYDIFDGNYPDEMDLEHQSQVILCDEEEEIPF